MKKTIFAPITQTLKSSTIIIRVSGDNALDLLKHFNISLKPKDRVSHLCILKDCNGKTIDQILLTYFKTPNSYTGENVIELAIHGSIAIYKKVIAELGKIKNFAFAEPGEFTKRAFLNKKIDLLQAEAIADLIAAETDAQADLALKNLSGKTSGFFNLWREKIITIRAFFEAYIDFPDEDIPEDKILEAQSLLSEIKETIEKFIADDGVGEKIRNGIKVSIIGPPNSGKSSLMNLLAKREVAIVSDIAGTTRDTIEVHLDLHGFPIILTDTAGIREASDEIEKIGVRKAYEKAKDSDFKILMLAANDHELLEKYQDLIDKKTILVFNKSDEFKGELDGNLISVKKEQGIDKFITSLTSKIESEYSNFSDSVITRERHRNILSEILEEITHLNFNDDLELTAEHLRRVSNNFGKLVGVIDIEDILDKIFSSFCIGK
jgi:tRNA modification GTPase